MTTASSIRTSLLAVALGGATVAGCARVPAPVQRTGRQVQFWSSGQPKSDVTYVSDAYDGEYRTWYESGAPYELRHYVKGHEEGLQQSWTEAGVPYLNYEVRNGRRFGLVNASPCNIVDKPGDDGRSGSGGEGAKSILARGQRDQHDQMVTRSDDSGLPYYDEPTFSPHWSPVPHRVAAFTLPTQDKAMVSDTALRGHPYVASFIYTQCAAVCPLVVSQLSRVQTAISGTDARIISFSVTPEVDTPDVLAQFGRNRHVDPRVWSLVTGSRKTIYALARASYFADDSRVGLAPDDDTAFLHTEKLLLVDGDGRLRGVYNGTQPHAVDQLIEDLAMLAPCSLQHRHRGTNRCIL